MACRTLYLGLLVLATLCGCTSPAAIRSERSFITPSVSPSDAPPGWGVLHIYVLFDQEHSDETFDVSIGNLLFTNVTPTTVFYCKPGVHEIHIHSRRFPTHREQVTISAPNQNVLITHLPRDTPPAPVRDRH